MQRGLCAIAEPYLLNYRVVFIVTIDTQLFHAVMQSRFDAFIWHVQPMPFRSALVARPSCKVAQSVVVCEVAACLERNFASGARLAPIEQHSLRRKTFQRASAACSTNTRAATRRLVFMCQRLISTLRRILY